MMHSHKAAPGTSELTAVLDKHDNVVSVERTGDRWRFKRIKPFQRSNRSKITVEVEQEVCAYYVDRPNMTMDTIRKHFGISVGAISRIIELHGLPRRNGPKRVQRSSRVNLGKLAASIPTPPPVHTNAEIVKHSQEYNATHAARAVVLAKTFARWAVTVTRTVIEYVDGDTLLDVAAHYDGTDARIIKVERLP